MSNLIIIMKLSFSIVSIFNYKSSNNNYYNFDRVYKIFSEFVFI